MMKDKISNIIGNLIAIVASLYIATETAIATFTETAVLGVLSVAFIGLAVIASAEILKEIKTWKS